jgi:hypothetical protein
MNTVPRQRPLPAFAGPPPASGARRPSAWLRLSVAAYGWHGAVQPRFLSTLLALGSTLAVLSVGLAWLLR